METTDFTDYTDHNLRVESPLTIHAGLVEELWAKVGDGMKDADADCTQQCDC
jgi:hypothetical protein